MSDEPAHALKRRDAERAHDRNAAVIDKLDEAAITSGQAALRAVLLVNGGAAVAMLAFIGSLASVARVEDTNLGQMAANLIWFAWGVAAAVIGMGFAYLANYFAGAYLASQDLMWEHPYLQDGASTQRLRLGATLCQVLAVAAGLASIVLFITGMLDVEASIGLLNQPVAD